MKKKSILLFLSFALTGAVLAGCNNESNDTTASGDKNYEASKEDDTEASTEDKGTTEDNNDTEASDEASSSSDGDGVGVDDMVTLSAETNLFSKDYRYSANFTITSEEKAFAVETDSDTGEKTIKRTDEGCMNKRLDELEICTDSISGNEFGGAYIQISNQAGDVSEEYELTQEQYDKIADLMETVYPKFNMKSYDQEYSIDDEVSDRYLDAGKEEIKVHVDYTYARYLNSDENYKITSGETEAYYFYDMEDETKDEATDLIKEVLKICSDNTGNDIHMETIQ